jgi:acyl carrier protein
MIDPVLKDVLIELGFSEEELKESTSIRQDLQLDSTETVDISLGLKRRLGINIKLESRQDTTLAQISEKIAQALSQTSAGDNNYADIKVPTTAQSANPVP